MPQWSLAQSLVVAVTMAVALSGCAPARLAAPPPQAERVRLAARAPSVHASLEHCHPLLYTADDSRDLDRPGFVRSASGMERFGNGLAILQDDLNSVGLVNGSGETRYLDLPKAETEPRRFEHARGNLHLKADYEAAFVLERDDEQVLYAFGSGTLPARERIVIVPSSGAARRLEASAFYQALRAAPDFAGGRLNLEAAEVRGEWLLLLQRGNAERGIQNALAGIRLADFLAWSEGRSAPPRVAWVQRYDLGEASGVGYGFSGLSALRDGRLVFTASAEGEGSARGTGAIIGSRLGLLADGAAWWAPIVTTDGALATIKVEGVVPDPDDPRRYLITTDPDDPGEPALICIARLSDDWPASPQARRP